MEDYVSNSHKTKERTSEKKIEKVVAGTVKAKKKSEMHKFTDIFISEDVGNVKNYILMDVLVPAIKKAVSDIVTNGIEMVLYGENGIAKKNSSTSKVSYKSYYEKGNSHRNEYSRTRTGYSYDDIILDNRGEAEDVLSKMDDLIDTYGMVSVADLYDLVGVTGSYTDNNYGWTNVRTAAVIRVREGYMLKLPKALSLN